MRKRIFEFMGPIVLVMGCTFDRELEGDSPDSGAADARERWEEMGGGDDPRGTGVAVSLAAVAAGHAGFVIETTPWFPSPNTPLQLRPIGDVNGDGLADIPLFGLDTYDDRNDRFRPTVVFGKEDTDWVLTHPSLWDEGVDGSSVRFGDFEGRVDVAGDVDADGVCDLLVGHPLRAGQAVTGVWFNPGDGSVPTVPPDGTGPGFDLVDQIGGPSRAELRVWPLGDLDGDGLDDLGTDLAAEYGSRIIFGKQGTNPVVFGSDRQPEGSSWIPDLFGGRFEGVRAAPLGDFDGDGFEDVILSSDDLEGASIMFGAPRDRLLPGTAEPPRLLRLEFDPIEKYGIVEVESAGDTNGDGLTDLLVGLWQEGVLVEVALVHGRPGEGPIRSADIEGGVGGYLVEPAPGMALDHATGVGDLDGDGLGDFVVTDPTADVSGSTRAGKAYVVYGKRDTGRVALADIAVGRGGFVIEGADDDVAMATVVLGLGDVNGDRRDDLLLLAGTGAPDLSSNPLRFDVFSRAYVVFGGDYAQ